MKEYTIEEVREKLATDRKWAERAIVVLHGKQTESEKITATTQYENHVGFNAVDAPFLSSLAESLKRFPHLTERQLYYAHKKLPKYAKQLLELGKEKQNV
jgi:hypothetical protein